MQRKLRDSDKAFADQVHEFVQQHWRPDRFAHDRRSCESAWRSALVAQGWQLPDWPRQAGGTGWSATQRFVWSRACAAAGAPPVADLGVSVVGPLLLQQPPSEARRRLLAEIALLAVRWSIGHAPFESVELLADAAVSDRHLISASFAPVADGMLADWLLCGGPATARLGEFALYAVDLRQPEVERGPARSWDGGEDFARVELHHAEAWVVASYPSEQALWLALQSQAVSGLGVLGGIARAQLDSVTHLLAEQPDEDLLMRRHALAVELEALRVMEMRLVDAAERGLKLPFPQQVVWQRGRDLLLALGDLQIACFGYYALPFPDQALLHNEGPIGPIGATDGLRHTLGRHITMQYENSLRGSDRLDGLKDEIAAQLRSANDTPAGPQGSGG